jgi:thioredoxin-like negative regulator of GroEL
LREQHRRAIELVFASFQGRAAASDGWPETNKTLGDVLRHMLDRVLSSFVSVEFALEVLQPFGWVRALELVQQIQGRSPRSEPLFALLEARLLLMLGRINPARALADRLCQEALLPDHERTRLLVHLDLAEGCADVAIRRLEQARLRAPKFFELGLQLAQTLIAADRKEEAASVCKALDGQIPGHPTLVSISGSARG